MGSEDCGRRVFDSLFTRDMRDGVPIYRLRALASDFDPCVRMDTYDVISKAEIACARVDEQAGFYRYKGSVRRNLSITESVSSVRIAGEKVRIQDVLGIEMYQQLSEDDQIPHEWIDQLFPGDRSTRAREALALSNTLHFVHRNLSDGSAITDEFILDTYRHLSDASGEPHASWRSSSAPSIRFYDGIYEYPEPAEIPRYMGYLIAFCNREFGSPTIKSAVAHYYFESIKPFSWGMDRMGRLLAHMIYSRDRMWRTLILPIGTLPAIATKEHAHNLLPYMTKADLDPEELCTLLNNWVTYCGQAMEVSARITRIYTRLTSQMIEGWLQTLGPIRSDSTTRLVLDVLPASPIFSIGYLSRRSDRSFSSVSSAIDALEAAGIVKQVTQGRRNRVFETPDALELSDWIEQQILPRNVTAREAYFDAMGSD